MDDPTSKYYYENYRRDGDPTKRPLEGNILTTLFASPCLKIPGQITSALDKYYLGAHYWLVHDTSGYYGSDPCPRWHRVERHRIGATEASEEGVPTPENRRA